jgi:hypothetical protein
VRVPYGATLVLTGRLSGSKTSGVRVRLLTRTFPFASPFADTGKPVVTSSKGTYKFTIASLTQSIRALVIADGAPPVISHAVDVFSVARVSVLSVKGRGRRVHIAGRVTPAPAAARASLQRLASNGRWVPVRRARLRAGGRYGFTVHRRSRTLRLRIAGMANDGGAHARGLSRELVLRPVS